MSAESESEPAPATPAALVIHARECGEIAKAIASEVASLLEVGLLGPGLGPAETCPLEDLPALSKATVARSDRGILFIVLMDRVPRKWGTTVPLQPSEIASLASDKRVLFVFEAVGIRRMADPGPELLEVLDLRRWSEAFSAASRVVDSPASARLAARQHSLRAAHYVQNKELSDRVAVSSRASRLDPTEGEGVDSLLIQARQLASSGSFTDAEVAFCRALVEEPNSTAVKEFARYLRDQGRFLEARELLEFMLRGVSENESSNERLSYLAMLGVTARRQGDRSEAAYFLRSAADLVSGADLTQDQAIRDAIYAFDNLGHHLRSTAEYTEAIRSFERGLLLARSLNDPAAQCRSLRYLGGVHRELRDFKRSKALLNSALEIAERSQLSRAIAGSKDDLASLHQAMGQLDKARVLYESVLEIHRGLGDKRAEALNLTRLARLAVQMGNCELALKITPDALSIAQELGSEEGIAHCLVVEADARSLLGDPDGAVALLVEAQQRFWAIEHQNGYAGSTLALAKLRLAFKEVEEARKLLRAVGALQNLGPLISGELEDLLETAADTP